MVRSLLATASASLALLGTLAGASCPWAGSASQPIAARNANPGSRDHVAQFDVDDSQGYLTTDVGGPIADQDSLKAGKRGPTLLEDFIFRQKMTRFDHERVPERAVHARGAGAYGTFTSYGNFSNYTAASFLSQEGKKIPTFVRFSTVAGSRGSADTVRDVHGFATRFYTDQGNFDIVGNNIPVFFIQDAIQFPDLIHAVKPEPNREIPQAATAHDTAWDYFSQQSTTMHTLFWVMSAYGIPRSYRHMDGFGVHTFRAVNASGYSVFIKWHWKTKQGKASLVWDEAQHVAGTNADYHRQDLWDAIEAGNYPEWELCVQVIEERQAETFKLDVLDATKIVPEEYAPLHKVGVMRLDVNPVNYFAETEQVMFQPGHIVRGIDFSEDPLLQGRIFSYLDTQLNRHGGPNFEQLPINRPVVAVHNNNRDGAAQNLIHKNTAAYSPNTLNNGFPAQANQQQGLGFFTAPGRLISAYLTRKRHRYFADHWTQPRLFYNSLSKVEQQFLIDAIRFETSKIKPDIQRNVLVQLNRISHDVAARVGKALGLEAPAEDPSYYHHNTTQGISFVGQKLPTIAGFKVAVLASTSAPNSLSQARALKSALEADKVTVMTVGETLVEGVDMTYSTADASAFDGIVVADGAEKLFGQDSSSTLYPRNRPTQILADGYNWGKPIGFLGRGRGAAAAAGVPKGDGVYSAGEVENLVKSLRDGLAVFKFTDRFTTDELEA